MARQRGSIDGDRQTTPRPDGILVLGKMKAVLEALVDVGQAGATEMAAIVGANKSTTFRLMNSMARIGLIDRRPDGTYALGLWLMELGSLVQSRIDIRRIAEPELTDLNRELGLTIYLTVRHGDQATCIDRVAGASVDVLALKLGGILPLHSGAGPRVLLAALGADGLASYLAHAPFPAQTTHSLTTAAQLRADVETTRRRGYALSMEDVTVGVAALGVPVVDTSRHVVAALSAAGLRHQFEGAAEARIIARLNAAAARISAGLGAPAATTPVWPH